MKKISPVLRTSVLVTVLIVSMQAQTVRSNGAVAQAENLQRGSIATNRIIEADNSDVHSPVSLLLADGPRTVLATRGAGCSVDASRPIPQKDKETTERDMLERPLGPNVIDNFRSLAAVAQENVLRLNRIS